VRCEAVTVRCEAVTVRTEAPTARCEAVTVRTEAPTARCEAVTVRCEAVTVRTEAPTARCEGATVRCEVIVLGELIAVAYGDPRMSDSVDRAVKCANCAIVRLQRLEQLLPRRLVALHAQVPSTPPPDTLTAYLCSPACLCSHWVLVHSPSACAFAACT
jgi:hypothetical protein